MENNEMMCIESSGKSVDEAIFKGLQQMGISIDEVSIEIIQTETKGILGFGAKPAKVRLTQRPPEEYEIPDYMKRREDRYDRSRNDRRERDNKRRDDRRDNKRYERNEKPEKREKREIPAENVKPAAEIKARPEPAAEIIEKAEEIVPAARPDVREKPRREKIEREEAPAAEVEKASAKVIEYTLEAAQGNPAAEFVQGLIEDRCLPRRMRIA